MDVQNAGVALLCEWYLFIYLEEMETLSGRVNEMSDRRSRQMSGKGGGQRYREEGEHA